MMGESIALDQARYAEGMAIEGMGFTDVRKVCTPLDPGMDLTVRQEDEEELKD